MDKLILKYFFIIFLLIFVFVHHSAGDILVKHPVVPYINGLPILISFPFILACFCIVFFTRNNSQIFNNDTTYLFLRIFVCLVPFLFSSNDFSSFSAHYPVVIFTFFAFCLGQMTPYYNNNFIHKSLFCIGLIITVQVLMTFRNIDISYWSFEYKLYMNIPIASTNVIAAYLSPILLLFIFSVKRHKTLKTVIISLMVLALILTKSRGGILVPIIALILYFTIYQYKHLNRKSIFILVSCCILISIIMTIPEVEFFLKGFAADRSNVNANSLSSGRLELFATEFDRFLNSPLFGNGMVFNHNTSKSGSHNLIIELLVQSGIIGTILYILPIIHLIKKCYRHRFEPNMMGWLMFFSAIILHGMIEVNFFNYSTDVMFWYCAGFVMMQCHPLELSSKKTQIISYHNENHTVKCAG